MKFVFEVVETLPMLAWCMKLESGQSAIKVLHGTGVDRSDAFLYEGCWDGELTAEAMLSSDVCSATGACISGDKVLLACPSNTLVRLYAIRKGSALWFSNSMAFIIEAAADSIREDYAFYQDDISSVIDGLQDSRKSIPLQSGLSIDFYFHCNLEVTKTLDITVLPKKRPAPFADFSAYREFLSERLASLIRNANLPGRVMNFSPLVSISRGYDSVACAVLARQVGCEEAVTMYDPESPSPYEDSGSEIAKMLDMRITEYSRIAYKDSGGEWEFFAVGTGGEDIFFSPMEKIFAGKIFISGFHGDKIWDKNPSKISDQIIRGDPSGADLEEFRLRVGFIHVAVPFFGCLEHRSIATISKSAEMVKWSVGGDYDRPICRRIAEEAGVVRSSFGQKKRVMSRSFGTRGLEWYLGPASLQEFREYMAHHPPTWKTVDLSMYWIARWSEGTASGVGRFSYQVEKRLRKITKPLRRYSRPFDETRQLFHWSFGKMTQKYRAALTQKQETVS